MSNDPKPGAIPPREGHVARPKRAEEMARIKAENAELRAMLGLDGERKPESIWESVASQELKDAMAARALIAEWGDEFKALIRLGYAPGDMKMHERRDLVKRTFDTPGVKLILARDLADIEARKQEILGRQVQIALYGDDDASVRAASQIAKVAGWQKTPDVQITNQTVTLYQLVNGNAGGGAARSQEPKELEAGEADTFTFLDHEPGEPVRIDSGDKTIDAALMEAGE